MQGALNATDLAPYIILNVLSFSSYFNGQRFTNLQNYFKHLLILRTDLMMIHCIIIYLFINIILSLFTPLQSYQQLDRITNGYSDYLNLCTDLLMGRLGVEYMIYVLGMLLAVHTQLVKNEFQSEFNCNNIMDFQLIIIAIVMVFRYHGYFGARMKQLF